MQIQIVIGGMVDDGLLSGYRRMLYGYLFMAHTQQRDNFARHASDVDIFTQPRLKQTRRTGYCSQQ